MKPDEIALITIVPLWSAIQAFVFITYGKRMADSQYVSHGAIGKKFGKRNYRTVFTIIGYGSLFVFIISAFGITRMLIN